MFRNGSNGSKADLRAKARSRPSGSSAGKAGVGSTGRAHFNESKTGSKPNDSSASGTASKDSSKHAYDKTEVVKKGMLLKHSPAEC